MMATRIELQKMNRNKLYRTLLAGGTMSIQALSVKTGRSIPTITQHLRTLTEEGLAAPLDAFETTGGRRAALFSCVADARAAVGVDITKNHVTISVTNLSGRAVYVGKREQLAFADTPEYYDRIAGRIGQILLELGIAEEKVLGAGVSLPSIVNQKQQLVTYNKILGEEADFYAEFSRRLPFRVELFNDANAAGFAEMYHEKQGEMAVYLMLSNSVGGAMIQNNQIYFGENFRSAEIGHVRIVPGGRSCYCGQRGCLNAYCSAERLSDLAGGKLQLFFERLEAGHAGCASAFREYLDHLALAVVNIRMFMDCPVILGGYVGNYMDAYLPELKERVAALDPYSGDADYLRICSLKTEASAVGASLAFIAEFIRSI